MFEEMMELISKKSEIQEGTFICTWINKAGTLFFYGYFSLTEPMHPMKLNIYLIRLKMFFAMLRDPNLMADELKVEFFYQPPIQKVLTKYSF